jgi:putative Mg2+ transporter-C (MgtC) family protein
MPLPLAPLDHYNFLSLARLFGPRVIAATICGAIVGIERTLKGKVVGLKTSVLICVGSTLLATISWFNAGGSDPNRITAQIVSGVGFIGASAIFREQNRPVGVTTAAFMWVMAAMGIIIGYGGEAMAITLTVGLIIATWALNWLEQKLLSK